MASSSSHRWTYDVFVSFKAEDVQKKFMDHLFSDFRRKGFRAYTDSDHLEREDVKSFELYRAIEQSRFLIVVFSDNYASSTRCLKELSKILECKEREKDKYEIRTIFYNVKPTVVRNQTGSYGEAITRHEASNRTEVFKWKEALTFAANLSGLELQQMTNSCESKLIDIISKDILNKLRDGTLHVGHNLVGLHSRAKEMNLWRFMESTKVHMIGICGVSGIGKTAVAKAIYNLVYEHFEECSFCEDVKGAANRHGLVHLQMKLLDDMKMGGLKVQNVSEGISRLKRRMGAKKVFIVLDDVDHDNQFEALAGKPDWFGAGSMILATGRDRQLLNAHGVEEIHEIDVLNEDEALELFSMYAFRDKRPKEEFIELASKVVHYAKGLPLALKTLGCILFNKSVQDWGIEMDKLQQNPHVHIQQVFRVSYDGLDAFQKRIFLDIACFFKGEKKDYVLNILDGCGLFAATDLRVLVDKSLITIREDRVQMPDMVQEIGWQMIREESQEPGNWSRLWCPTEVCDVLNNDKGTELVKGLALDVSSSEVNISCKTFTKLSNLRLLNLYIGSSSNFRDLHGKICKSELRKETKFNTTSQRLEYLSNELQFLCWHGYPFQYLPSAFYPESLVVLDMSYSCIKQVWSGPKGFKRLTLLKLGHCHNLKKTPDFTGTSNLKELILEGCENLVGVHPSVGALKMLTILNLENCKNLKRLPDITELESLKFLILSGCSKIRKLPEDLSKIKALLEFRADGTSAEVFPSSLFSLSNLEVISLGRGEVIQTKSRLSFFVFSSLLRKFRHSRLLILPSLSALSSLKVLNVSHCNLSGASLNNLESLFSLEVLDLSGNDFSHIHADFSQLSRLLYLRLIGCKKLQALPKLPSSIINLDAQHCTSLEELPKLSTTYNASISIFDFKNCPKVAEKKSLESLVMTLLPQGRIDIFEELHIFLPGSRIPGWFSNQSTEDCVKVELPRHWRYEKFKGLATCAVVTPESPGNRRSTYFDISCHVRDVRGAVVSDISLLGTVDPNVESDQVWLCYRKPDPRWKEAENYVSVSFKAVGIGCRVRFCGVRLVCEEDERENADGSKTIRWLSVATEDEPPWKKPRVM